MPEFQVLSLGEKNGAKRDMVPAFMELMWGSKY